MRYIPATEGDIRAMLDALGIESIDALFEMIPAQSRLQSPLDIPEAMDELSLNRHMRSLAEKSSGHRMLSFLGGGAYQHYAPALIDTIISRSEYATAYTPYQPEVSQGTLKAIFEFQSYVCELFQMDVSNASVYDGASGVAEACLMADRIRRHRGPKRILVSRALHPHYRATLRTYLQAGDLEVVEVPLREDGSTDLDAMEDYAREPLLACIVQSPNYLGVIENLALWRDFVNAEKALFITVLSEPLSMGLLAPPGAFGADIVVAEGQSFGLPVSYGGPYVGMMATKDAYVRSLPGRLVGRTVDAEGRDGYVLTLATREQHIRREKATSNICTNQGLYALCATLFLSLVGKEGLRCLARKNLSAATWLKRRIEEIPGLELRFSSPGFNEFVVRSPRVPVPVLLERLESQGILGGIPLAPDFPEYEDAFLVAVTETALRTDLDRLLTALKEALQ